MREYSITDQERILKATQRSSEGDHTRIAERTAISSAESEANSLRGETPDLRPDYAIRETMDTDVIQLMVDLESESKFVLLLRRIQRRLAWF